jgi:hypothetical protein
MAKNFWENDPLAEEASFWKDDPIVEIEAPKVEEPQQSSKFRRYIADPALGLSKGVVGAVEAQLVLLTFLRLVLQVKVLKCLRRVFLVVLLKTYKTIYNLLKLQNKSEKSN